jgi:hypothetical protein
MTGDMKEHQRYIEKKMESIDSGRISLLLEYHQKRMGDFQHERLIHLIVTSFVIIITAISVFASFMTREVLFFILDLVLLPLTFAYLLHYRTLENGVQELYVLTKRLRDKIFRD